MNNLTKMQQVKLQWHGGIVNGAQKLYAFLISHSGTLSVYHHLWILDPNGQRNNIQASKQKSNTSQPKAISMFKSNPHHWRNKEIQKWPKNTGRGCCWIKQSHNHVHMRKLTIARTLQQTNQEPIKRWMTTQTKSKQANNRQSDQRSTHRRYGKQTRKPIIICRGVITNHPRKWWMKIPAKTSLVIYGMFSQVSIDPEPYNQRSTDLYTTIRVGTAAASIQGIWCQQRSHAWSRLRVLCLLVGSAVSL